MPGLIAVGRRPAKALESRSIWNDRERGKGELAAEALISGWDRRALLTDTPGSSLRGGVPVRWNGRSVPTLKQPAVGNARQGIPAFAAMKRSNYKRRLRVAEYVIICPERGPGSARLI